MSKVHEKQLLKRSEIIKKSMKLLQTVPFEEINVKDICDAAGISVGSFYHYFEQKNDIVVGMLELIDVHMSENVFPKLKNRSEIKNISDLSKGYAKYIVDSGIEQAKLVIGCRLNVLDEYMVERPLRIKLIELVERGQRKGEIIDIFPPEHMANLIMIAMSGVAVDWSRRDGDYSLERQMEDFVLLFFDALKAKE